MGTDFDNFGHALEDAEQARDDAFDIVYIGMTFAATDDPQGLLGDYQLLIDVQSLARKARDLKRMRALAAVVTTPHVRAYLDWHDPKLVEQVVDALSC